MKVYYLLYMSNISHLEVCSESQTGGLATTWSTKSRHSRGEESGKLYTRSFYHEGIHIIPEHTD